MKHTYNLGFSSRIGYFHQNLFRYAGNGWVVSAQGFDVENDDLHIYVELKNKHNSMNSESSQKTSAFAAAAN